MDDPMSAYGLCGVCGQYHLPPAPDEASCADTTSRLLLEEVAAHFLKEHQEMKNFTAGFGPREQCHCPWCDKAREAFRLMGLR